MLCRMGSSYSHRQLDEEIQVVSWVCSKGFAGCLAELPQLLAATHVYVLPSTSTEFTDLILMFDVNTRLLAGPGI